MSDKFYYQPSLFDEPEKPAAVVVKPEQQLSKYICHKQNGIEVDQRPDDGYINATAMCRAYGKLFAEYRRIEPTEAFLAELSANMGIPIIELVQSRRGQHGGGTWVHPQVAVHLSVWISPPFAVAVTGWVLEWMQGRTPTLVDDDCFEVRRLFDEISTGYRRVADGTERMIAFHERLPHLLKMIQDELNMLREAVYGYGLRPKLVGPRRVANGR